jgi:hypothetical protein
MVPPEIDPRTAALPITQSPKGIQVQTSRYSKAQSEDKVVFQLRDDRLDLEDRIPFSDSGVLFQTFQAALDNHV